MGKRYQPIQNKDAFGFFDAVVGEGKAVYEVVGALRDGAQIFILANAGDITIAGEDHKKYLLLTNSHNGTLACQMFFTPVRVVCANTLAMALANDTVERFYTRHTTNALARIDVAKEILGLTNNWYEEFKETADRLSTLQLPSGETPLLLKAALGVPLELSFDLISTRARNQMEEMASVIENGVGLDNQSIKGSRWAAYNGVVEYVDHHKSYNHPERPDSRVNGSMLGSGNMVKARAWKYLTK